MKSLFPSHFASDAQKLAKLWGECIFVFDTNVLTGLYKYSDETRDALYRVIESLGERLWIPYQVIFEHLDNRAKIVHDQSKLYDSAISKLEGLKSEIDVPNRAPFVAKDIYEEFCLSTGRVLADLKSRRDLHVSRITNDDVKAHLAVLLDGKVGPAYSEEVLVALSVEGEARYSQKIPPGFEDRDKHKGSLLLKEVNKRYGDFIFWRQILDKSKDSAKSVILVTGENKEDWWSVCAGKTIGPLPELIEEFLSVTGNDFYIYSTPSFLQFANEYLQQNTSVAAVDEVRDTFVNEKETSAWEAVEEQSLLDEASESRNADISLAGRRDVAYYEQLILNTQASIDNLESMIQNVRGKIVEAELVSSITVVNIQKAHLSHLVQRRKALKVRQRRCSRKVSQMLDDEVI